MHTSLPRIALMLAFGLLGATGCAEKTTTAKKPSPARVEAIDGSTIKRVVLEPKAVERLDIKTDKVRVATPEEMAGIVPAGQGGRTVVPFDAVLYDNTGATFAYTVPKPLEYLRQPITVEGIRNKVAVLTAGPPPETVVVTVGSVLLYGAETGVGK